MEKASRLGGEPEEKAALAGSLRARQALCSSLLEREWDAVTDRRVRPTPAPLAVHSKLEFHVPSLCQVETPIISPYFEEFLPNPPLCNIYVYTCMYRIRY